MDNQLVSYLEYLEIEMNASPLTLQGYRHDIIQFMMATGGREGPVEEADHHLLRGYLAWLNDKGYTRSSVARKLSAVRSFLGFLQREGELERGTWSNVSRPLQEKNLPQFFYYHEVVDPWKPLIAAPCLATEIAHIELLYASGLRVSELTGLERGSCDVEERLVRLPVKAAKSGSCPWAELPLS